MSSKITQKKYGQSKQGTKVTNKQTFEKKKTHIQVWLQEA
jgi:hypothetical protein